MLDQLVDDDEPAPVPCCACTEMGNCCAACDGPWPGPDPVVPGGMERLGDAPRASGVPPPPTLRTGLLCTTWWRGWGCEPWEEWEEVWEKWWGEAWWWCAVGPGFPTWWAPSPSSVCERCCEYPPPSAMIKVSQTMKSWFNLLQLLRSSGNLAALG